MSAEREMAIQYLKSDSNTEICKVRIRNINPLTAKSLALEAAMRYFNHVLEAQLQSFNLTECYWVDDWLMKKQKNLYVEFDSIAVRNRVYNKRSSKNRGLFDLCDELDAERLAIWKRLCDKYEPTNVITYNGGVVLLKNGKAYFFVLSKEVDTILKSREDLILRSYCNICQAMSCDVHDSA